MCEKTKQLGQLMRDSRKAKKLSVREVSELTGILMTLLNKSEFYRKLQMHGMHGKKIAVCWRIYAVLVELKESGITGEISKANLMRLAKITNWNTMLERVADLVRVGIITDTWEIAE